MSASNERPVDLHQISLKPVVYQGEYPVSRLFRLLELLTKNCEDGSGQARYRVEITPDQRGIWLVSGEVDADILVDCQRCFEAMRLNVRHQIRLAVVASEAVFDRLNLPEVESETADDSGPKAYEPWLSEDGLIRIIDMVEDELILAIPLVNMHDLDQCPQGHRIVDRAQLGSANADTAIEAGSGPNEGCSNPFSVLKNFRD